MDKTRLKIAINFLLILGFIVLGKAGWAESKIVQKEKMSFEKCLNVIDISTDRLLITPSIFAPNENKRVAIFNVLDGTLTITCDGKKGFVIVETDANQ